MMNWNDGMDYYFVQQKFEQKIKNFNKVLFEYSKDEIGIDYSYSYRVFSDKLIFDLRMDTLTFGSGFLELWYYLEKGYYWCRFRPDNSSRKISSNLLKIELQNMGILSIYDDIAIKLKKVYENNIKSSYDDFRRISMEKSWKYYFPGV